MSRVIEKHSSISLRTLIIGVIALGFVILLVATYRIRNDFVYSSRNEALTEQGSNLLASGNVEVEEIIPGLLLSEEKGALDYILQRIKEKDGLAQVKFVSKIDGGMPGQCREISSRSSVCIDLKENVVKTIHRAEMDGQVLGFLIKEQKWKSGYGSEIERPFLNVFLLLISVLLGVVAFIAVFLQRYVRKPILSLEDTLRPALNGATSVPIAARSRVSEIQSVFDQVQTLVSKYQDARTQAALGEFAAQVAHDIISPITTLRMTVEGVQGILEKDQTKIGEAIERVRKIATTLRDKQKKILSTAINTPTVLSDEAATVVALSSVIESSLVDKKQLYLESKDLRFEFANKGSEGASARIQKTEFQRLLSNLLDNAVEAVQANGRIEVSLTSEKRLITLSISDNGIGIPKEVISRLGQKGVTVGKMNGLGLGLYHARTTVESWGGTMTIQSEVGKGTTITAQLPSSSPNFKYISKIKIQNDTEIVVVDDAPEMAAVWKSSFYDHPNPFRSFSNTDDFEKWFTSNRNGNSSRLFLFDLEIGKSKLDGIDLIEKYGLISQSILVTGRFDDSTVIDRCQATGIKVLPKTELDNVTIASIATSPQKAARRVGQEK